MWTLRHAGPDDFRKIYDLQNVPMRIEVLGDELPPFEQFLSQRMHGWGSGNEKYFLLEKEGTQEGFLGFTLVSEFWHVTLWGRWLKTLIHCCGLSAFDHEKWPRLVWSIHQNNLRWIKVCEKYPFRFLGETSVMVTLKDPPYIGVAKVNYYDIAAETFFEQRDYFEKNSHPVQVAW